MYDLIYLLPFHLQIKFAVLIATEMIVRFDVGGLLFDGIESSSPTSAFQYSSLTCLSVFFIFSLKWRRFVYLFR